VARRIQSFFLPRTLPQPAGWQLAAFNRGAEEVGGDFYDCITLPGGLLAIVMADVAGKGVPAALFVALCRSLVRAATLSPWAFQAGVGLDAEDVLRGAIWLTNDYITREHGETAMFITLFYALLNPADGTLMYVNAGHNPPVRLRTDGSTEELFERTHLPLGVLDDEVYQPTVTTIAPGETLFLFTDGITEAMDAANQFYGDERLTATLVANRALAPSDLVRAVLDDVLAHTAGAPQSDDQTMLVVRRS
jgi:phosphoserine phosphatase RsbU/P